MRIRRFALSFAVLLLATASKLQADPIRACVNPHSGEIKMLVGDACRPGEELVTWNTQGPQGPQGLAGPAGEQGPAGADGTGGSGGALVIDANGQTVGNLIDAYNGVVLRKEGSDTVWLNVTPAGIQQSAIFFFHNSPTCGDARLLQTAANGSSVGFAFFGQVHGGAVFYTKAIDPQGSSLTAIHAYERIDVGVDATIPGSCIPWEGGSRSLGTAVAAVDPVLAALVAPFAIK